MTAKKKKLITIFAVVAALLVALIVWIAWGNTALELNTYTITSDKLPEAFDGYSIAHISDLHNAEMGEDNEKLLSMLRSAEPEMIAITGDLIDSRNTNVEIALEFAKEVMKVAPCAVLELAGITDILSKSLGSNTPINMVRATIKGLSELKQAAEVAKLRGKSVEELLG